MASVRLQKEGEPCRFCSILRGDLGYSYDTILSASEGYSAIASVGALVPGWVLICPTEHRLNMSELYADSRFTSLRLELAEKLRRRFDSPVRMFEHGPSCDASPTGCGVNHAHTHLVPHAFSLSEGVARMSDALDWRSIRASQLADSVRSREYLFYSDHAQSLDAVGAVAILDAPVSQYFRKVIARQLRRDVEYDYRTHPNLFNVEATALALYRETPH